MLAWFRRPTSYVTTEARKVLAVVAQRWIDYSRERRSSILAQLVWESRWDGLKNRFKILLDETAVEETYRALRAQDWDDADRLLSCALEDKDDGEARTGARVGSAGGVLLREWRVNPIEPIGPHAARPSGSHPSWNLSDPGRGSARREYALLATAQHWGT